MINDQFNQLVTIAICNTAQIKLGDQQIIMSKMTFERIPKP